MVPVTRTYLAAEAGQPLSPTAQQARAAAAADTWADRGLLAHEGRRTSTLRAAALASLASSLRVSPDEVRVFADRGAAIRAAARGLGRGPMLVSPVERRSALAWAGTREGGVVSCRVDHEGAIALDSWHTGLSEAGAAWLQVGNPEVGTTQPVAEAAQLAATAGVPLVVDASMAMGRMPLPSGWQVLLADSRSWAGGDGTCLLIVRRDTPFFDLDDPPDGHNTGPDRFPAEPGVADLAAAAIGLEWALPEMAERFERDMALTRLIRRRAAESVPDVVVHGSDTDRLPHVVGLSVLYLDAEALLSELDRRGIAVASGSACTGGDGRPSHVLAAIGGLTSGNIRVSLPLTSSEADVEAFLTELPLAVAAVKDAGGVADL
jgi:cysteine desulfurase